MQDQERLRKYFLFLLLGIFSLLFLILIQDIFTPVLLGLIIAAWFQPVYRFLKKRLKLGWLANTLSILLVMFTIIIPALFLIWIAYRQLLVFSQDLNVFLQEGQPNLSSLLDPLVTTLNSIPQVELNSSQLVSYLQDNLRQLPGLLLNNLVRLSGSLLQFFTAVIIFIFALSTFFPKYQEFINYLKKLSPFPEKVNKMYIDRFLSMAIATIKGNFLVAIIVGIATGITLRLIGVDYSLFWMLMAIFLNIIPLGSGLIVYPLGLIKLAMGDTVSGIILILAQLLILSNIDNVLRPRMVPKDVSLNPLLVLISVLGGIQLFGFWGFMYGPLIAILLLTTLQVYQDSRQKPQRKIV